jgi:mono/diheme cytochrome c family protein
MKSRLRKIALAVMSIVGAAMMIAAWLVWNADDDHAADSSAATVIASPERGRYLTLVGNCAGCHSLPGAQPYSGGYGVPTPYGTIYAGNLTPSKTQGIGDWSDKDFWRALHHGRSKSGRLLYPAFPYTSYTNVNRTDSNDMFAYLKSLPPSDQVNREHDLQFPYNTQAALAIWRALYFKPVELLGKTESAPSDSVARGAYLVNGLAHCAECHAERGRFGAVVSQKSPGAALRGGVIPVLHWYAPSLASVHIEKEVATYLKVGRAKGLWASGPMAEVVYRSTQYLTDSDANDMAAYLASLPRDLIVPQKLTPEPTALGEKVYVERCESCHGKNGEGSAGGIPALAFSHAVLMNNSASIIRIIVEGGFGASTKDNPRPYGMPPFGAVLSPLEIAAVVTHIRSAWGNKAGYVSELEVLKYK